MRLLIAKLTSTSVQSVSVALNSETDIADLATDLDNCVKMLRNGGYDLVLLITSQGKLRARDAITRLRREAGRVPMVVLTEPSSHDMATLAGALGGMTMGGSNHEDGWGGAPMVPGGLESAADTAAGAWSWQDGVRVPVVEPPALPRPIEVEQAQRSLQLVGDRLRAGGREVALSQAEARLFAHLWARRGRIASAEDLMAAIYEDGERPASRVLPVFLFKLRRKLTALGLENLIETAIGRGFMIRAVPDEGTPAH